MDKRTLREGKYAGLAYRVFGEGPIILWAHGFAEDATIWDPLFKPGIPGFRHIVPYLPGTGPSPLPNENITIDELADALYDVLQQEKVSSCILLGHSMGGYIGIAFAEKYPHILNGLGMIQSSVYEDDAIKKANRLKGIDIVRAGGKAHFFQQLVPALYSETSQNAMPETIRKHFDMAMTISDRSVCAYYLAMHNRPDRRHILKRLNIPVAYVLGEFDGAVPLTIGLEQSTIPTQCLVDIIPDIAHSGMNENPKAMQKIINNFCQYVLRSKKM